MPWPVHPNGLLGAQGDNDNYQISRSLRFNSGDTTYLTRTFGTPTNQNVWTLSVWLKRSAFSSSGIFGASSSGAVNYETIYFDSSSNLLAETWINSPPIQSRNQKTNAVFRDASAWYHFVVVKNGSWASSYPYTIYVNGISQSVTTFDLNTSFVNRLNSSGVTHQIGADGLTTNLFNGYMAEFQFIDGQALTPSSFGETDAITGRWKAKAYSGTYGANGFYLKFADNSGTTSTTLGKDSSPNGNNWTPNNFSVTAGAGNDSLVDSPTNYGIDTGVGGEVRGNYATLNPLDTASGLSDGNLRYTGQGSSRNANFLVTSGKWYFEGTVVSIGGVTERMSIFYSNLEYRNTGQKTVSGVVSNYGSSFTTNDIIGVAINWENTTATFYKNGVSQGALSFTSDTLGYISFYAFNTSDIWALNFGQRPFAYTAPTGFKALCTTNLPTPTIKKPSSYFDAVTYTGNNSTNNITSLQFNPDLVWIKSRSSVTNHSLNDSVRGVGKDLYPNLTNAESTTNVMTSFNSNGFSLGPDGGGSVNGSSLTYVAWSWDEATISGMDIVGYTGTGSATTVAHSLGVAPKMMIVKSRSRAGDNWDVYHASVGATGRLYLNLTNATDTSIAPWNNTAPTSSVFTVGTAGDTNATGVTYIAYLFAEVEGFSKFGSYTGNASADGPFIYCGFRPKLIIGKRTDAVENWIIYDTSRDSFNVASAQLQPNTSIAETTANSLIDFNSNGFKFRSTNSFNGNSAGGTHIFAAFAESPFKYARAR